MELGGVFACLACEDAATLDSRWRHLLNHKPFGGVLEGEGETKGNFALLRSFEIAGNANQKIIAKNAKLRES